MRKGHVIMHLQFENRFWEVKLDIEDYIRFGKQIKLRRCPRSVDYVSCILPSGRPLARAVLDYTGPMSVDHISNMPLDNRKRNLRLLTAQQNAHNRKGTANSMYSKYKGVSKDINKTFKPWVAKLSMSGVNYKKNFATELEAALYYDVLATKYFAEFAYLNFPKKKTETENGT